MTGAPQSPEGADLAGLLSAGERAAFHGPPGVAIEPLEQAVALAGESGRVAEAGAATWLLGVALGACGRYGEAFPLLAPLVAEVGDGPERLVGALAAATVASLHRQLGQHAEGRAADEVGLALAEPLGPAASEALVDCTVGLAADAVGLGDADEAHRRLDEAEELVAARSELAWRPRVRVGWVRTEVALLDGDPEEAEAAAGESVRRAERARAPRHVAKSLLFLGVAQSQQGSPSAVGTLRRAATLAEGLGALPLVWPSRAVLGALLAASEPGAAAESERSLAAARAAVRTIADGLPADQRAAWLARPDLVALLAD